MNEEDVFKDLLVELECPICTHYMQPPIRQCKRGHSICNECASKLITCPTCQIHIADDCRSYALEKLAEKLARYIPCHNRERGCVIRGLDAVAFVQHKLTCHFNELECLLAKTEKCNWRGIADDMRDHCLEAHNRRIFMESENYSFIRNFATRIEFNPCAIYIYDQFFKIVPHFNSATGFFGWCVLHLSSEANTPERKKNYRFQITFFEKKDFTGQMISLCGLCPLVPFGEIANDELEKYLMGSNMAFFKNFCEDGDMYIKFTITKPDDKE